MKWSHIILLFLLMSCAVLVVGQLYVTIPLGADIAARFGVASTSAAWAGSAFGLAYAVGVLLFGLLSDRYGRKSIVLPGLIGMILTTLAVGLAPNFSLFLAARAAQGFAAATFAPTAISLVAETLSPDKKPLGISLMSFSFLAAAPLAQFLATQTGTDIQTLMIVLSPLYALGAFCLLIVWPGPVVASLSTGHSPAPRSPLRTLLNTRSIVTAWGAALGVLFSFIVFQAAIQRLAPFPDVDLQVFRLAGLPPLLLTLAAAPLSRRFGAAPTAQIGLVLAITAMLCALSGYGIMIIAANALLAAGVALAVPGLIGTIASRANDSNRGLALAIYTFVLFTGASIAPPVAEFLSRFGLIPTCSFLAGILGLAVLLLGRPAPLRPAVA